MKQQAKTTQGSSNFFGKLWQKIWCSNKHTKHIDHDVAPKQVIKQSSSTKNAQHKFIDEGGNSQSLKAEAPDLTTKAKKDAPTTHR